MKSEEAVALQRELAQKAVTWLEAPNPAGGAAAHPGRCLGGALPEATATPICWRGDVLVMQMLLLHRSLPSNQHRTRRVIRSDFANRPLPTPLQWAVSRR